MAAAAFLADGGNIAFSESRSLILALASVTALAKLAILAVETGLVFPDLRRSAVVAFGFSPLVLCRETVVGSFLAVSSNWVERRIDGRLIVGLFALDHRGDRAQRSCRCPSSRSGSSLTASCCATTGADTEQQALLQPPKPVSFARPPFYARLRRSAVSRRPCLILETPRAALHSSLRQNIRDYAVAAPRGSRSRPVRRSPACRYGRSCIRATAPRRSR